MAAEAQPSARPIDGVRVLELGPTSPAGREATAEKLANFANFDRLANIC